jgi:hypothetical protein
MRKADENYPGKLMRIRPHFARVCLALLIVAGVGSAKGQGTVGNYTNIPACLNGVCEVPPNGSGYSGDAILSYNLFGYNPLLNTMIACTVDVPSNFSATDAAIYGPAGPGQTGVLLFDLGPCPIVTNIIEIVIWPGPPIYTTNVDRRCTNTITVTPAQMADLNAGLWYVNVTSDAYPSGEIRGQITQAPVVNSPVVRPDGSFAFKMSAPANQNYRVEFSTNLVQWSMLTNVNTANELLDIVDAGATNCQLRFYRAGLF